MRDATEAVVVKFTVQISIPGYLDAEDELSNLLQGEGAEEELRRAMKDTVWAWLACWMPDMLSCNIRIRIKQK